MKMIDNDELKEIAEDIKAELKQVIGDITKGNC